MIGKALRYRPYRVWRGFAEIRSLDPSMEPTRVNMHAKLLFLSFSSLERAYWCRYPSIVSSVIKKSSLAPLGEGGFRYLPQPVLGENIGLAAA